MQQRERFRDNASRTPFPSTPSQQMLRSTCWGLCISASSALMFKTPICRASPSQLITKCERHHLEHLVLYKWNKLLKISPFFHQVSTLWGNELNLRVIDVMKPPNWYFSCASAATSPCEQTLGDTGEEKLPFNRKEDRGMFERGKYLIMVWVSI